MAEKIIAGLYDPILSAKMTKKDYVLGMNVLITEIVKGEQIDTEIISYSDPIKLAEDFQSGKLNMIACDPLTIVENIPYTYHESGIMGYKGSKKDSQTLLLVGLSSDHRSLSDKLKGTIASDGDRTAQLYLKTIMLENGIYSQPEFLAVKNPQQSILKLFFKKADLALVDQSSYLLAIELNPQLKTDLTILISTPLTISSVSFFRQGVSAKLRHRVIDLGKKLHTHTRGKQVLSLFRGSYVDECRPSELESVYALKKRYDALLQTIPKSKQGKKQ